jgi:hypothetical protein
MKLYAEIGLDDVEVMNLMWKTLDGSEEFSEKEELFLCSFAIKEYFTAKEMRFRDALTPFMSSLSGSFMNNESALSMAKEVMYIKKDKDFKNILIRIAIRTIAGLYNKELDKEEE